MKTACVTRRRRTGATQYNGKDGEIWMPAIPSQSVETHEIYDYVSPKNYETLIANGSPKACSRKVKIITKLPEIICVSTEDNYLAGGSRPRVTKSMQL